MRERAGARGRHGERGSALLLFPAGMLILLVLAAICFDLTLAFQRKRQLVEVADGAASDAVTAGLDAARLRASGEYCLDQDRVRRSVAASVAAGELAVEVVTIRLTTSGACPIGVEVTLAATAPYPFGRAVPGMPSAVQLEATSRASAIVR